jgi:proline racemase
MPVSVGSVISAVEVHAAGEEGRVITGGVLDVPGDSVADKARCLETDSDGLRLMMLREPRGYPVTCCNLLVPSRDPRAVAGFIIMQQTEYPPMSGSNAMCVAAVLLKTGMVPLSEPVTSFNLESPSGLVAIRAEISDGKVGAITVRNVPSFVIALDLSLELPGFGAISVDVAYGGNMFVSCEARQLGFSLVPDEGRDLVRVGQQLKAAANDQFPVEHPEDPQIASITITQMWGPPEKPNEADMRNAVVLSTEVASAAQGLGGGILDRSPCGTGTCAKMAIEHARGTLAGGASYRVESMLGTVFAGQLVEQTVVGRLPAVIPEVSGRAWITGFSTYIIDGDDPFPEGFTLGDIWS